MQRHAEIAGAGIGGLSSALMLARLGWTVRIHERSLEVREVGAGIFLKNNAIEVLEDLQIFDRLVSKGIRLGHGQYLDRNGRVLQDRVFTGRSRVHVFLRQTLIEALVTEARSAGVEIVTGSTAIEADPGGALLLDGGRRYRADLVIVADGARSRVRDSFMIGAQHQYLPTVVNRYLVPSREITPDHVTREYWSGRCRIGLSPCGDNLSYVYQVYPEWDLVAAALPSDLRFWSKAFPRLRREIEILGRTKADRRNFSIVRCPSWQKGRVAIIGDAAHGLPPTLGQGAGLTLMNAQALTIALERMRTVEEALPVWESAVRFVSDRTQRWAMLYDRFTRQWPAPLWFMRPAVVWAFRSIPALNRRMRIADQGFGRSAIDARLRAR